MNVAKKWRALFVFSSILLLPIMAFAQTGKIRGVVTDEVSGEPLIGVNVIIEGTQKGTATDINGEYILIGVRPGKYDLEFSYIGFSPLVIEGVQVSIDQTTTINTQMSEQTVEGEEVVITAVRDLVQKDVTASLSSVGSDEIDAIPVENLGDVVGLQAGVVDGHFRGGRTGEVGYWVDGVPVTDVYSGGGTNNIENNSVQEVQVVTGAFNAEYGQAMSGIVNIVTKDGSNDFHGSFESFSGDYLSTRDDLFRNIDDLNPISVRNLAGTFEGPIVKDKLFFFVSGRYFANDGWLYGRDIFDSDDVGFNANGRLILQDTLGTGDSSFVAMNPYEKISTQAKLTWRMTKSIRLVANTIFGFEDYQNYNHGAVFMPEFTREQQSDNRVLYLKMTHTLSDRTFYNLSISNNFNSYESYQFEDRFDDRYLPNQYTSYQANNTTSNFLVGGTNNGRFSRSTDTYIAKLDVTSQMNNSNQVKGGLEFRYHNLQLADSTVIVPSQGSDPFMFANAAYDVKPIEFSGYIQDKIEIGDLIINAGVRFDFFDAGFKVFSDPTDPNVVYEDLAEQNNVDRFTPNEQKWQISPRLGIAFPISAGGVVHFSYGHFFQIPNFELLYQNPYFRLNSGGSGLIGLLGNSNLSAQKTINGEIGMKQELTKTSKIEITAYFRDIRNLAGSGADPIAVSGTSARYGKLQNSDFGFVKGLVLSYDQRLPMGLLVGADYTYQVAKGNASDPAQIYNALAAQQELEKQIVPLNWDQLHTVNATASYAAETWGFGSIFNWGSGFPYTPNLTTIQSGEIVPTTIPLNSRRKPVTWRLDFDAYKNFNLAGDQFLQLYIRINNVFDTGNENGVFGDTGRASYSLQKNIDARTFTGNDAFLDAWYTRPDFYNEPRRVVLGVKYNF